MTDKAEITFTLEELKELYRLIDLVSSQNQMDRISGRFNMRKFVAEHGKQKCDAMFIHLEGEVIK